MLKLTVFKSCPVTACVNRVCCAVPVIPPLAVPPEIVSVALSSNFAFTESFVCNDKASHNTV